MSARITDDELLYALKKMRHGISLWKRISKNPKEAETFRLYSKGWSGGMQYAAGMVLSAIRESKKKDRRVS